jgi:hypothetical protein
MNKGIEKKSLSQYKLYNKIPDKYKGISAAVLCVNDNSFYKSIPDLEVYDRQRDAYNFPGGIPVITHAPCQQWSKLLSYPISFDAPLKKVTQLHSSKRSDTTPLFAFWLLENLKQIGGAQ